MKTFVVEIVIPRGFGASDDRELYGPFNTMKDAKKFVKTYGKVEYDSDLGDENYNIVELRNPLIIMSQKFA